MSTNKINLYFLPVLLLSILLFLSVSASAAPFKFTAIPDQNTARLQQRFSKVAAYLTKQLGFKVSYVPVKSYAASVQAFTNNEVQMAWFGGLSGVQARLAVPGSVAVAQGDADRHFITYFIVNTATGIQKSDTLPRSIAGKTFTFGSKDSTSGRLMPEYYIRKVFGKSPNKVFSRVGYSGNHTKTIALVQSGSYQVGAVNFKVWQKGMALGHIDPGKVRVIWATPQYPDYNWTVRGDVDKHYGAGTIQKIQKALLDLKDPKILNAFPRKRFVRADNTMYQAILKTGKSIGIFR